MRTICAELQDFVLIPYSISFAAELYSPAQIEQRDKTIPIAQTMVILAWFFV